MKGKKGSAFLPAIRFMRSELERRDHLVAWNRSDEVFFAAGACHILAFRFVERHPEACNSLVWLKPHGDMLGSHVYVSSSGWAFDFNGWTPESVLVSETTAACRELWPEWSCELVPLNRSLDEFCWDNRHRLPQEYAFDPTDRADSYLDRFPERPPSSGRER